MNKTNKLTHLMKVGVSALSIAAVTLMLQGCGSSDDSTAVDTTPTATPEIEPNDTFNVATPIPVDGGVVTAAIGNGGADTDYFSFTIDTVGEYFINPGINCTFDQALWIYDTDGTTALVDDQDFDNGVGTPGGDENCESAIYNFTATGTYYLKVEQLSMSGIGTYGVEIRSL